MINVYSKNDCVKCKMLKKLLHDKNIAFREINVSILFEKDKMRTIEYLKRRGFCEFPVVFFRDIRKENDFEFSGFAPNKVDQLIEHMSKICTDDVYKNFGA